VKNGAYAVYPRTQSLEQVQAEYKNQLNGNTADKNMAQLGRGENPRLALSGAARKLSDQVNLFNVSIINLETGVQENGLSREYQNLSDGLPIMAGIAEDIALSGAARTRREAERERTADIARKKAEKAAEAAAGAAARKAAIASKLTSGSFRRDMSPFLFSIPPIFWDCEFTLFTLIGTHYYTYTGGNSGYSWDVLKINWTLLPYTSVGVAAGFGLTADGRGIDWNWVGSKIYAGLALPFGPSSGSFSNAFLFFADALLEIGYSDWGGLVNAKHSAGFGINPGFETGLDWRDSEVWTFELVYSGTWYSGNRYKHSIGIAWKWHAWP
jgi:hypothetical protein